MEHGIIIIYQNDLSKCPVSIGGFASHARLSLASGVCQMQRDARTDDVWRMRAHSKLQYVS